MEKPAEHYRVLTNNNPHGGGFNNTCGLCGQRWPCEAEQEKRKRERARKAHLDLMRQEEAVERP